MLSQEFIRNALLAGTPIALAGGALGWFVLTRGQLFAGDALSHVAFTGALAAAAVGVDLRLGLFAATVAVACALAALADRGGGGGGGGGGPRAGEDAAIGVLFSWVLGLGVLFLYLYATGAGAGDGTIAARTLFGTLFGLSASAAWAAAAIGLALLAALALIARPLLFATFDPLLARARGVPLRGLGLTFLVLLGLYAGEATQAVGALLLLGLLAAPAGAALRLTANPARGLALSMAIALGSVWAGVALSYRIASLPPGSAIVGVAIGCYLLAALRGALPSRAS